MTRSAPRPVLLTALACCCAITFMHCGQKENEANTFRAGDTEAEDWIRSGRNFLEWGDREQAVALLERAERLAPEDPELLSDLSEALLLEDRAASALDVVRALEHSTHALELAPDNARACLGRAKALERLFLTHPALETVDRCLDLDIDQAQRGELRALRQAVATELATPTWEVERQRLFDALLEQDDTAVRNVVARFPYEVRNLVESELIPSWANAALQGHREESARILATCERLSRAVYAETGERLAHDAVEMITRTLRETEARSVDLAEAHSKYAPAAALASSQACDSAQTDLVAARNTFRAIGTPFEYLASFDLATCAYHKEHADDADTAVKNLAEVVGDAPYKYLLGRIHWLDGLTQARQSNLSRSLEQYEIAAAHFRSIRDEEKFAAVCRLMAETLNAMGHVDEEWQQRLVALRALNRVRDSRYRHQILFGTAVAAFKQGYARAAIEFESVGAPSARSRSPIEFIAGVGRLAVFFDAVGRVDDARQALADARLALPQVPTDMQEKLEMEIAAAEGAILFESDPTYAASALDEAIAYCEPHGHLRLAELYPLRGRAHLEAGDLSTAEKDLQAGIDFFEKKQAEVFEARSEITYRNVVRTVYDEMIRLQATALGRHEVALAYAERARARLLLRHVSGGGIQPSRLPALESSEIVRRTPADTALVYYVLLDDRVLTWVSRDGELHHVDTPVDRRTVAAEINELIALLEFAERPERARTLQTRFHDLLIRPLAAHIADSRRVILLPDKSLNLLPFAALVDRTSGRYLVQDHELGIALSATLALGESDRPTRPAREAPDALIVANPELDWKRREVPDLKGAEDEARRLAELYDSATLLTGARATRARFLDNLGRDSVLHFAGHALADSERPLMSRMLLAADPGAESGDLLARDLYGLTLENTQLVVLAACETAAGDISSGEGAINLARPFLAAGVPATVATLWRIDDKVSPELFVRFHESYRAGTDPIAALRIAQLELLMTGDPALSNPGAWAATQVFVGMGS